MKNTNKRKPEQYHVKLINSIDHFEKIREDWENVYDKDPNAHLFISWLWMRKWLESMPYQCFILAVQNKVSKEFISFMPLHNRGKKFLGFKPIRQLYAGGHPFTVYAGIICLQEYETIAFTKLALYIQQKINWDIFRVLWVRDARFKSFLSSFSKTNYTVLVREAHPATLIELPDSFEKYLKVNLSRNYRKILRRRIRFIEISEEYCVLMSDKNTIERDISILISLWKNKWGQDNTDAVWYQNMMQYYFQNDLLWLFILWHGSKPASALSFIIDPVKKIVNAYVTTYDPKYSKISPGNIPLTYAIISAITNEYKFIDFGLGLDNHKLMHGAKQKKTEFAFIQRRKIRSYFPYKISQLTKAFYFKIKRRLH